MNAHVVGCIVTGYETLIPSLALPDPDDRHVLAAAIRCGADIIVTSNLNRRGIYQGANDVVTITIQLSDEEQLKLAERAARNGRDLADYVHLLIERDVQEPSALDQALAPLRRQVEESGMTDDELGDFFEEVREEVWQEKYGRPSKISRCGQCSNARSFR
jgi:hypothetical protein